MASDLPDFVEILQRDKASHETIACPLCGGRDHAPLFEGVALRGNDLRLDMCQSCSHMFINPRPSLATFEEFYAGDNYFHLCADHYEQSLDDTYAQFQNDGFWSDRGQHGRRLLDEHLTGELGSAETVFDFGCGDGGWLWGLQQATGCAVAGEEISALYVKVASDKLGVQIFAGPAETTAGPIVEAHRNSVKVALVSGSLQHMLDPMLCLRAARDILVENGLLYVCNWSILDHFMVPWRDQPRRLLGDILSWEHLHYFHETSFRYMAAAAGFEIISFAGESTVRPRHMEFVARKADAPAQLPSPHEVDGVMARVRALESATLIQKLRDATSMPEPEHSH